MTPSISTGSSASNPQEISIESHCPISPGRNRKNFGSDCVVLRQLESDEEATVVIFDVPIALGN